RHSNAKPWALAPETKRVPHPRFLLARRGGRVGLGFSALTCTLRRSPEFPRAHRKSYQTPFPCAPQSPQTASPAPAIPPVISPSPIPPETPQSSRAAKGTPRKIESSSPRSNRSPESARATVRSSAPP